MEKSKSVDIKSKFLKRIHFQNQGNRGENQGFKCREKPRLCLSNWGSFVHRRICQGALEAWKP